MPTELSGTVGDGGLRLAGVGEMEVGGPGGTVATTFEGYGD